MCCWILESTLFILGVTVGMVGLIRGKVPITPKRYLTTLPACLVAGLLILPFPFFALSQGLHFLWHMIRGENSPLGGLPFLIAMGLTPFSMVLALVIVLGYSKRVRPEKEPARVDEPTSPAEPDSGGEPG